MQVITKLFEIQAETQLLKTALSYRRHEFTYQYINESANRLAAFLIENGVQIEDRIGIAIDRSPEMLIALIAVMKAGAAYVPLDPVYPPKRIEYMLADSSAKILLTTKNYQGKFKTTAIELVIEDIWPGLNNYPVNNVSVPVTGHNLAYIIYTSGSTGLPKGVQVGHHNLYNLLLSAQQFPGINADDKLLALTTISFDISVLELFLPLITGAALVLAEAATAKDGMALMDTLINEKITIIQATPFTYKMLIEAGWDKKLDLKVICGGEALPKDLAFKLVDRCSALYNMYGPTETTIYSTGKQIKATDELITIGRPINNTRVYILDESLEQVEPGETGEICIAGEGVTRGYLNKPELTAKYFIDDRFSGEGKLYRTGDLGRILPSGEIECFGRIDNQVKIRGYRIELTEIEYVLRRQKAIKEAVVIAPELADEHTRLIAFIVSDFDDPLSTKAIKAIQGWKQVLKNELPVFMIPNELILLKSLPLTENGKTDRNALVALAGQSHVTGSYTAPQNNLESLLAEIWQQYLGVDNIGINDTFFELGGDSLTAMRIITRIEKETGKRIRLAELLEYDTVQQLAALLQKDNKSVILNALVPLKPEGTKVPLYIVHGNGSTAFKFINFAQLLDDDQPVFGLQAIGIDGFREPFDNVEEIASEYIKEILRQNPKGPYSLSGYSFGGIIAFEMAKQLTAQGKTVSLLAMLEGYVIDNYQLEPGFYKTYHKAYTRILKFMFGFYLLRHEPQRTINFKIDTLKRQFNELVGKDVIKDVYIPEEELKYIFKVAAVHQTAIENYRLKPYNGDIYVFRAKKRSFFIRDFKYLGWKPYAKSVKIFNISGEHMTIFDPPQNKHFANLLQKCLDECNKQYNK